MSSLRDQIAKTLRATLDHQIVAEWICCDPVNPDHSLCLSGYQVRLAVRTLLEEDEDNASLPKILDALEAAVLKQAEAAIGRVRKLAENSLHDEVCPDDILAALDHPASKRQ